jgi:futalosine hydrolase
MGKKESLEIAILGAVPGEVHPLHTLLSHPRQIDLAGNAARTGIYLGKTMLIGSTGLGKVNAAVTTAALLERFQVGTVWNVGTAGAYAGAHLRAGDVLITRNALFGDEGVLTRNGALSAQFIGIPVLSARSGEYYDGLPLDLYPLFKRLKKAAHPGLYRLIPGPSPVCSVQYMPAPSRSETPPEPASADSAGFAVGNEEKGAGLRDECFTLIYGPSLTVGMTSGDDEVAAERFARFRAFAENMEGSAVAQACFRYGTPMLECRGISNIAGDRDRDHWEIERALRHCHGIVLLLLREI